MLDFALYTTSKAHVACLFAFAWDVAHMAPKQPNILTKYRACRAPFPSVLGNLSSGFHSICIPFSFPHCTGSQPCLYFSRAKHRPKLYPACPSAKTRCKKYTHGGNKCGNHETPRHDSPIRTVVVFVNTRRHVPAVNSSRIFVFLAHTYAPLKDKNQRAILVSIWHLILIITGKIKRWIPFKYLSQHTQNTKIS